MQHEILKYEQTHSKSSTLTQHISIEHGKWHAIDPTIAIKKATHRQHESEHMQVWLNIIFIMNILW